MCLPDSTHDVDRGRWSLPLPTSALRGTFSRTREKERPSYGCTTVIAAGTALPTPRISGRYMSSTSGGGTV